MMKVIAFNGSPRPKGNADFLIRMMPEELKAEGIETETMQVGGKKIRGCTGLWANASKIATNAVYSMMIW